MVALLIRPFEAPDLTGVSHLILSIQQQKFGIAISREDQPDLSDIPSFYQSGAGGFWIAKQSGMIVGTIGLKKLSHTRAALRKMFVASQVRGREYGVAARLIETLTAHWHGRGVTEIYLGTSEAFLAAHRFYEKNGFVEVARSSLPEDFPVMEVDRKFYRLVLS